MNQVLAAARAYAARGLEVFPLRGKMPAISTEDGGHGLHDATTDDAQLVEWFETFGFTNIGIAIPAGIVVMDVDTQHDGHTVFKAWNREHGKEWMLGVPRQRTGNGGIHAWFRHPGPLPRYKHPDFHGIEMGRVGRYVIGAPSIHPNGTPYKWEIELPEHIDQLVTELPGWLIEAFQEPELEIKEGTRSYATGDDPIDNAIHEFTSWGRVLGAAGWKLVKGDGDSDRSVWRHPNATGKQSATIKYGCLFVYSPNTPFPETTYGAPHGVTLFSAYTTLEHGGDASRAARILRENGYLEERADTSYIEIDELVARLKLDDQHASPPPLVDDVEDEKDEDEKQLEADRISPLGVPTNWFVFWRQEEAFEERWLSEPIIANERAHALYAGAKTGKSLLLLQLAAALTTGQPFLDKPEHDPIPVVYCDYEMTEGDLRQRLTQFGYGPQDNLDPFWYFFLGSGQALDTKDGGLALIETAHEAKAKLVVIDTTARAVSGAENDADTLRAFYRCAGVGLKRLGIAWVRVDHGGKDVTKGQRGTSAKNDDVDVVWRLAPAGGDDAFILEATHQRMGWVPKQVPLELKKTADGGLEWDRRGERKYGDGVRELAAAMKHAGVPVKITQRPATELLHDHRCEEHPDGISFDKNLLGDAIRFRDEETFGGLAAQMGEA